MFGTSNMKIEDFMAKRIAEIKSVTPHRRVFEPPKPSRRAFFKQGAAVLATAALFNMVTDLVFPDFARAANAVVYVDSAAVGLGTGASWLNAYVSLAAAIAGTAATTGVDYYVANTSAETFATAQGYTFKGAAATPDRVFSCDKTNSPPQTSDLVAGASCTTTGTSAQSVQGNVYIYGVTFNTATGTAANSQNLGSSAGELIMDTCAVNIKSTTGTNSLVIGFTNGTSPVTLYNTPISFAGGTASTITLATTTLFWKNTPTAVTSVSSLSNLFTFTASRLANVFCDGVDLTGIASGKNIVSAMGDPCIFEFINCKITSGALFATPSIQGGRIDLIVSDPTQVTYGQQRFAYQGTLTPSTSVHNAATDGVTAIGWQIATTSTANPQSPFECFEIVQWAAAGTYAASKIVATCATAGLTNADVWVDVEYLGSSGNPLALKVGSGNAPLIPQGSSPSNLSTGATWAVGGLGTNYTLAIPSFTALLAGYVRLFVKVGKPSILVVVDPLAVIA